MHSWVVWRYITLSYKLASSALICAHDEVARVLYFFASMGLQLSLKFSLSELFRLFLLVRIGLESAVDLLALPLELVSLFDH